MKTMSTRGCCGAIRRLAFSVTGCRAVNSSREEASSENDITVAADVDVTQLSPAQLAAAERVFHELKREEFLPFHKLVADEKRQELDRQLLVLLGYPKETHPEVHVGVDLLRKKLCAEPSIHGGKK